MVKDKYLELPYSGTRALIRLSSLGQACHQAIGH